MIAVVRVHGVDANLSAEDRDVIDPVALAEHRLGPRETTVDRYGAVRHLERERADGVRREVRRLRRRRPRRRPCVSGQCYAQRALQLRVGVGPRGSVGDSDSCGIHVYHGTVRHTRGQDDKNKDEKGHKLISTRTIHSWWLLCENAVVILPGLNKRTKGRRCGETLRGFPQDQLARHDPDLRRKETRSICINSSYNNNIEGTRCQRWNGTVVARWNGAE